MQSFGNELLRKLLSAVIIFQITFSPLAFANDDDRGTPPPASPQLPEGSAPENSPAAEAAKEIVQNDLFESALGRSSNINPLDYNSLLRQDFYEEAAKDVVSNSASSVLFRVLNTSYRTEKQFAASESLLNSNFDGLVDGHKFQIRMQNRLIHDFRVPIDAIGVLGNYIVFIEKGSYNQAEDIRHISFIDLDYFRLAKQELPIFRVPVEGVAQLESFTIDKGTLYINGKAYEQGLFNFAATLNRVLFNISVNLTDAVQLANILEAMAPFMDAFKVLLSDAAKESSDANFKNTLEFAHKNTIAKFERIGKSVEGITPEAAGQLSEAFVVPLKAAVEKVHASQVKERSLIGRLGLVQQELTIPRPAEVGKLKEKIMTVAVALKYRKTKMSDLSELGKELATNRTVRYTTGALAAAAMAFFFPEASLRATLSTLEMVNTLGTYVFGKAVGLAELAYVNAVQTFVGFNPVKLYEVYIANGAWHRTSVGVSSMFGILALVVAIPHVILNSYYLAKDFKNDSRYSWRTEEGKFKVWNFIKQIKPNLILRQQTLEKDYLNALSQDKKKSSTSTVQLSDEQMELDTKKFFEDLERQELENEKLAENSLKSRVWNTLSEFVELQLPTVVKGAKYAGLQWKKFISIESFVGALRHFVISWASLTKSAVFYAATWNYFYMARLLILHPRMAMTFMFYPRLFRRAVATELGQVTPPSYWNGGSRWLWQEASIQVRRIGHADKYKAMKEFESSVVPVEKEIGKAALQESLKALTRYLDSTAESIVKLSERSKMRQKLSAKDISELSYDARTFFASYYDIIVENATRNYLSTLAANEGGSALSRQDIKKWFIENHKIANTESLDATRLIQAEVTEENYQKAYDVVHKSSKFISKIETANRHHTIRGMDSETNGKIRRFVLAEQQMKKPSAMARAVRSTLMGTIVDKPMEFLMILILTAGITDGPNKPLFDEMFGPNSAFYLSRNVHMGFLSGLIVSIFADVWVKIQQDTRVDKLGGFEQVPQGEHAKKGFFSWYSYQFKHNKNNKWWDHHKYNSEIIFHNMGPAFILMTIMGMATLGRVDLDFYFLGYITAFFLPFSGLSLKLEQTFEIASGWVLRNVPEGIRNHPQVLSWANGKIAKLRFGFQIYYKVYENILGQFIGNLMAVTTPGNGTRALSRILFGGKTITEHVIGTTTKMAEAVPATKFADSVCRLFFSKNYTSGPLPPAPK